MVAGEESPEGLELMQHTTTRFTERYSVLLAQDQFKILKKATVCQQQKRKTHGYKEKIIYTYSITGVQLADAFRV